MRHFQDLKNAVAALDVAAGDDQPYAAWDTAKWRVFNAAVRLVKEGEWPPLGIIVHGKSCPKKPHDETRGGYLHDEHDDQPYDVDHVAYCGRCHQAL